MSKFITAAALAAVFAFPAFAQKINLDFPGLADRAEEVVDITVDANMLKLAAKFFNKNKPDERALRDMISGLEGIYVRSYEFAKDGEYDRTLVDHIKRQLGSNWQPLVTVRSKKKENVNIYARMAGESVTGLVIIAAEPREFTVVNINGPIDIERLSELEGQFGIPEFSKKEDDRD
jgi:hypothetical protein